ncbi:MAG: hypothetical protein V4535_04070 [Bacteroidota bacterium]
MSIIVQNGEIDFPSLERFKKVYPQLLSKYLSEYIDNTEKMFIELSIKHYKTYGDEHIKKEGFIFKKIELEKLYTSRLLIVEYLEDRLELFPNYKTHKSQDLKNSDQNHILNQHSEIFSNNGYVLFDYILNKYVRPKDKRGRFSDIADYYWKMHHSKPQYIHQRPETFKRWFFDNNDNEDIGKLKTPIELKNPNRDKYYSDSLDWFKANS